jgi:DNA-binding transcriptional LysR family regulator
MPWNERTKRRLKLRDLDILMAVIETGSMGKAAGRLNISQPAISKAIVELEDALGVQLVDRSPRGVVPTPYGEALGRRSIAVFNDLRQGVQDIDFLLDPTKGEIRIGSTEPIISAIVSPAIDRLCRKYPKLFFHIIAGDTSTLYQDVLRRNVEFSICRMIGPFPDELSAEIIFQDSPVVMASADNPLTRRRRLTLDDLADEPWVLFPFDSFFGSLVVDMFRANGHEPPRVTATSLSFNMQMELLATGRFLTVLPSFLLRMPGRSPRLRTVPVTFRTNAMPVGIITLKDRTLTPLAQLVIDHVRTLAQALVKA